MIIGEHAETKSYLQGRSNIEIINALSKVMTFIILLYYFQTL